MKKLSPAILAMCILVCANKLTAQPAATVKKQIIGTWVNGDNPDDIYIFSANGDCREVFQSGKKSFNYKYSITNDIRCCDPESKKLPGDSTSYIQLKNNTLKKPVCYVIDEITPSELSIRSFGQGGGSTLYIKRKTKR